MLEGLIKNNTPNDGVIVFDIDNTLISYSKKPLFKPVKFYYYCLHKGFDVYIITARLSHKQNMHLTIQELKDYGIIDYKKLYFMKPDQTDQVEYKIKARKHILDSGKNILLSIGDQPCDYGKYGGIGVRVKDNGRKFEIV